MQAQLATLGVPCGARGSLGSVQQPRPSPPLEQACPAATPFPLKDDPARCTDNKGNYAVSRQACKLVWVGRARQDAALPRHLLSLGLLRVRCACYKRASLHPSPMQTRLLKARSFIAAASTTRLPVLAKAEVDMTCPPGSTFYSLHWRVPPVAQRRHLAADAAASHARACPA